MFRALVVLATAISVASATKSLSLSVSAPESVADVSTFAVVTTIANTGDETLKLLNDPRSALSSWATNTFEVSNTDGVVPEFTGVIVRYDLNKI